MEVLEQDLSPRTHGNATPKGFEPSRAEPNGFLVHLSHSDAVSCVPKQNNRMDRRHRASEQG